MTETGEQKIGCPQCNNLNIVYPPLGKYRDVRYEPCEDDKGEPDHNLKVTVECTNCYEPFAYYWCTGHTEVEGASKRTKFDRAIKWPQT